MAPKQRKQKARRDRGDGSVFEYPLGSGKWHAQERIEGKLVRRRATSEQGAKARLEELQELKRRRVDVHKGSQTFEDWLNTCHQEKKRLSGGKPRTTEHRLDMIERYIIPKMGSMILMDIRPPHIQSFVDTLYAEIRTYHTDKATGKLRYDGARTTRAAAAVIQEATTLAFERHLIPDNPYSGIRLPKYRRRKIEPMTDEQCRVFMEAVTGQRDMRPKYTDARGRVKRLPTIDTRLAALWLTYLLLGIRRGEGLGLRWVAFNREKRTIKIEQQVQRVNGSELIIGTPKTEDSERELPLPWRLFDLYCERWDDAQAERELKGVEWHEHGLIFPSEIGTPLWPDNVETMFRRLRAAAGLPDTIKLHHLRHTLATLVDECGATEALKADILGHAKQTQSGKYTHGRIDAMRRVLQDVEHRLFGGVAELQRTGT